MEVCGAIALAWKGSRPNKGRSLLLLAGRAINNNYFNHSKVAVIIHHPNQHKAGVVGGTYRRRPCRVTTSEGALPWMAHGAHQETTRS